MPTRIGTLIVNTPDGINGDVRSFNMDGSYLDMVEAFKEAVRNNIEEVSDDGLRDLTEDEIEKEIQEAIDNEYDWSGNDTTVQVFFYDLE